MRNRQSKPMKTLVLIGLCVMFAWLANAAWAEEDPSLDTQTVFGEDMPGSELGPDEGMEADQGGFGNGSQDFWVGATQFYPRDGVFWQYYSVYYWTHSAGSTKPWEAQVTLPAGARITFIRVLSRRVGPYGLYLFCPDRLALGKMTRDLVFVQRDAQPRPIRYSQVAILDGVFEVEHRAPKRDVAAVVF